MKILGIYLVRVDDSGKSQVVARECNLSSFNFFQRSSAQEFMIFLAKTLAERTQRGTRHCVEEEKNIAYSFTNINGICCVIICDMEYPSRVANALTNKCLTDFTAKFSRAAYQSTSTPLDYPELSDILKKYQNPEEADPIMKVQKELDETTVILHKTMNGLLERGEKMDDLVARSDELSAQSKVFFKTARKTNSCCIIQ